MTGPGIRKGYILELSEKDKEIAKEELGEDPTQTKSHVETLRAAVQQMKHLNVPTDDAFLLTFLRHAKFSQLRAREVLDNHARNRATDPYMLVFNNGTELTSGVKSLLKKGATFALPDVIESGPRTVVLRAGLVDTSTATFMDIMAAMMVTMEIAMLDPVTQVNGIQYINDRRGCNLSHYAILTPSGLRILGSTFVNSMPVRYKSSIIYQAPTIMNWAIAMFKSLVSQKIASRIHVAADEAALHTHIDPRVLPEELGGSAGTYEELAGRWCNHVQNHLDNFKKSSSVSYDASKKVPTGDLEGAFRKLSTE